MRLKEPDVGAGAIEASDLVSDGANCLAMRATRWADVEDMGLCRMRRLIIKTV